MSKNFNPQPLKGSEDLADNLVVNHRPGAIIIFRRTLPKPLQGFGVCGGYRSRTDDP